MIVHFAFKCSGNSIWSSYSQCTLRSSGPACSFHALSYDCSLYIDCSGTSICSNCTRWFIFSFSLMLYISIIIEEKHCFVHFVTCVLHVQYVQLIPYVLVVPENSFASNVLDIYIVIEKFFGVHFVPHVLTVPHVLVAPHVLPMLFVMIALCVFKCSVNSICSSCTSKFSFA